MAQNREQQLKELGSKLERPPSSRDAIVELLKEAASCLSELDQTPSKSTKKAMQPLMNAIAKPTLLKHEDEEVKLFVASCACEITRITAPEAPYEDEILKDLFHLIVGTLSGLSDIKGPSFGRRVRVLETLATYRSCVLMLDLECDNLIDEMFNTLFAVVSDEHPENVLNLIQTNMEVLLEESEDVPENFLLVLLSTLGHDKEEAAMAARRLAMNVIKGCAARLEPGIKHFFMSSMSGDSRSLKSEINYDRVLYDICRCAPQILSEVIPYLTAELLSDRLDTRLKAVSLVGGIFTLRGSTISETFKPVLSEFLGRLTDRDVVVRMSVLEYVENCLLENPFRVEAQLMMSALCDRLRDTDENVRKQVVSVVCDVACHTLTSIPVETIKIVSECLQDKSLLVKRYAMERLADIHRVSCKQQSNDGTNDGTYDWIAGKLLRCFYDIDFGSDAIEPILSLSLFPDDFSVKEKVTNWIRICSGFEKVEIRALEKILDQKQRLQQEMQTYLSVRQLSQEGGGTEIQEKVKSCFRLMSRCFCYPVKAEDDFQTLDQLKNPNVCKILMQIIDPMTSSLQAINMLDDLLNILGQEHQLYEFLRILSMKCSYSLFDKDHVRELFLQAGIQRSSGNTEAVLSCMTILAILAEFCPLLFGGIEEDLVHILEDDDEIIKESTLHILTKVGGTIREKLAVSSRSLELALERICIEGSRWQAKYAVHALAAIAKEDGLMSLSVLYKRLVDMLEEKLNLPAVLQSLGCIAEVAMPVFERRESEVEKFIKEKILKLRYITEKKATSWDDRSELCSLKIFGIKALVKSYLPVKDARLRCRIDGMIRILKNVLLFGDISRETNLSLVDRAHLKLAAAKAVLRLSNHWENKIPVDVLYLTLQISEDNLPEVRELLFNKVHQYVRHQILDPKYACAILIDISSSPSDLEKYNFYLNDIIQMCRQGRVRQISLQTDSVSLSLYPEYILSYVIHSLAHRPSFPSIDECKDVKTFEPMYRQLYLFLSMLVPAVADGKPDVNINKGMESSISLLTSIFQRIRFSEDAVDASKSKNSHALCHLGMQILKLLAPNQDNLQDLSATVSLPSSLYKPLVEKGENNSLVGKERTLLLDEDILAHFESLDLEANKIVQSAVPWNEFMVDSETEGSDMPLEKLMKHLRADEPKRGRNKYEPAQAVLANENDFETMKMDNELQSDDLGTTRKFDKHKVYARRKRSGHDLQETTRLIGVSTDVPVPKRRRTRTSQVEKFPSEASSKDSGRPTSANEENVIIDYDKRGEKGETSSESNYVPEETGEVSGVQILSSCTRKRKRSSSSLKPTGEHSEHSRMTQKSSEAKKHKKASDTDSTYSLSSSQSGSEEEKPKTVSRLPKQKTKDNRGSEKELVGRRIKVWWPLDRQYYEGIVRSYKAEEKKHEILYDDGETEVLHLEEEKWEFIGDRKAKGSSLTRGSLPKVESPAKRKKSGGGPKLDEKLAQKSPSHKKKWTPRRSLRQEPKTPSKSKSFKKGRGIPDILLTDPTSQSSGSESDTEKETDKNIETSEEQSNKDHKQEEELGKATSDAEVPEDDKKESEDTDKYDVAGSPFKARGSDSEVNSSSEENKSNEIEQECVQEDDREDKKGDKCDKKISMQKELSENEPLVHSLNCISLQHVSVKRFHADQA